MRITKTSRSLFLVLVIMSMLILATPVTLFADSWEYSTEIRIQDTGGASRIAVPVLVSIRGQDLIDANYTNSDATDTRTLEGTSERVFSIDDQMTGFIVPNLVADQLREVKLRTGYSPLVDQFPVILGSSQEYGLVETDYYTTDTDSGVNVYNLLVAAQTFTTSQAYGSSYDVNRVQLKLYRTGSPGELTIDITATTDNVPSGSSLTSGTLTSSNVTTDNAGEWYDIDLTSYSLTSSTLYAIKVWTATGDADNKIVWLADGSGPIYAGGMWCSSPDGGSNWTQYSGTDTMFKVYRNSESYVTVEDVGFLNLGDNFEVELKGWIDTAYGTDKNLIYKEDAFKTYISGAGNITSALLYDYDIYSSTNDGTVEIVTAADYNDAWTAATGTVSDSNDTAFLGQAHSGTFYIWRDFVYFNTTGIPNGAEIESATLKLYGKTDHSDTDFDIVVQNGQPDYPHDPLVIGDYDKSHYSSNGGSMNTADFVIDYNSISLDETGMSWINRSGVTKLCLRSSREIAGTPSGAEYVEVYMSDNADTDKDPKLEIIYSVPVTASGVSSGEYTVKTTADETDMKLWIDGVEKDSKEIAGTTPPFSVNDNNWLLMQNDVMPYMNYIKMTTIGLPTIRGYSKGVTDTDVVTHNVTLPSDIETDELLLVVFSVDVNPTCTDDSGLWTKLSQASYSNDVTGALFYKVAVGAGNDTLTITTSDAQQSSHIAFRISNYSGVPTATSATGYGANPDPPSHNPGVAKDYLWIVTRSGDGNVYATEAPSSYSNLQTQAAAGAFGASSNTAERELTASSEDPGEFTCALEEWVCFTISIPPASSSTEKLWLQPISMTTGLTLPDRSGTGNDGTIARGSNKDLTITIGSTITFASTTADTAGDGIPANDTVMAAEQPGSWYGGGTATSNLPFYEQFSDAAHNMGMTTQTLYLMVMLGMASAVGLGVLLFTGSQLISAAAAGFVIAAGVGTTVLGWWMVFVFILAAAGILYLSRQY